MPSTNATFRVLNHARTNGTRANATCRRYDAFNPGKHGSWGSAPRQAFEIMWSQVVLTETVPGVKSVTNPMVEMSYITSN